MISSLNVKICRETLFLIDIYIISLFVLMSFDNYIYLILKKVDFYLSIVKICEVAVLFGFYCVMCWTGTFVIFLPEIYYCVVILWCQSVCLMYYWCSKGIINEIGYKPFFFFDEVLSSRSSVVRQWLSYQPLWFILEFLLCFLKFCVNVSNFCSIFLRKSLMGFCFVWFIMNNCY